MATCKNNKKKDKVRKRSYHFLTLEYDSFEGELLVESHKMCTPNAANDALHGAHDRDRVRDHDLMIYNGHRYSSAWSCPSRFP